MNLLSTRPLRNLWLHQGFQRYFFNTGWLFLGQVISFIVAFFVGAYVARYLGPTNYGFINYAVSFAGLFAFLVGFGVDSILNRELIKTPEKKDTLLSNAFWMKFFGGILVVIIVNVVSFLIGDDYLSRTLLFLFSLTFLFQGFGVFNTYFQSQVQARVNTKVLLTVSLIVTAVKLAFVFLGLGVIWFISIFVFETALSAAIILIVYYSKNGQINWSLDLKVIKSLLKDSWPLMFSTAAFVVYTKIDQTFIKHMLDQTAVGVYAVAVKLSEVWYFLPNLITASLFPAIINAKKTSKELYQSRLSKLYRLMLGLALIITIPSFFLAPWIVVLIFGEAYLGSVKPFQIYIWSSLPVFLMAALNQYLLAENYTKIQFVSYVAGATANVILNIILIPRYGIVGSAIATLISYFVPLTMLAFFSDIRKHFFSALVKNYNFTDRNDTFTT